ncbi:flavin-containing monooxygenase [Actinokineospora sp. NPDC004072]
MEHVDVLIVGAGLSGVGAACQLRERVPGASIAVVEARSAIGGTWDLFRYPGVRSDSDMFTLGYSFRPWRQPAVLADGTSIREYIQETAREYGVDRLVRFNHRVTAAAWDSGTARWAVTLETDGGAVELTCGFIFSCTGYYRYDEGHTPDFPGREQFSGPVVHPQHWPQDLDWSGKRVAVVGSGATAVTLVPALAEKAEHVVMVQRSPSYVVSLGSRDPLADRLRKHLPARIAHPVVRWKNALGATLLYKLSKRMPDVVRTLIRWDAKRKLPDGYPVDTHFRPRYQPWDQRMCFVPDADLFRAIGSGRASVVTDAVTGFTPTGLALESGAGVDADIVVTATGLSVLPFGGIQLTVDGTKVDFGDTVAYKGMMLSGVPNLAVAIGYTNASWTLKCDLVAQYVCRLLRHMRANGLRQVTPLAPDPALPTEPFIDLKAGYVLRALDKLPRQGPKAPWRLHQNYPRDVVLLRHGPVDDAGVRFS